MRELMHPSIKVADGRPMMVIRPATAEGKRIALQTAAAAVLGQKPELLEQPPADDYVFVGYLSRWPHRRRARQKARRARAW